MTSILFRPASRKKVRGRIGLDGPAGSGKTFTALRLAFTLAGGRKKIAVINSESGAVEKYLGLQPDGTPWQFDVCELPDFAPTTYTTAILEAGRIGYDVIVIDSLSHAWNGVGGALEIVSKKGGNSFTAWKDVTPMHNAMIEAILRSPAHVIATIRSKMDYVMEEYEDSQGRKKTVPRKVGMAPIQRNGMEYEFDVFADLDATHTLTVSKTRCPELDGMVVVKPGAINFEPLVRWLNEGSDVDPSYYIASEADLQKSLAAREAMAKQLAGANGNENWHTEKVDAKELMRQRAAAAAKSAAPLTTREEPTAAQKSQDEGSAKDGPLESPAATSEPVSAATLKRIDHYGPLAYGDQWADARAAALKKRGVGRLAGLDQDQADDLLSRLMARSMGLEAAHAEIQKRIVEARNGKPETPWQEMTVKN